MKIRFGVTGVKAENWAENRKNTHAPGWKGLGSLGFVLHGSL